MDIKDTVKKSLFIEGKELDKFLKDQKFTEENPGQMYRSSDNFSIIVNVKNLSVTLVATKGRAVPLDKKGRSVNTWKFKDDSKAIEFLEKALRLTKINR